jgi:hypothetical protein
MSRRAATRQVIIGARHEEQFALGSSKQLATVILAGSRQQRVLSLSLKTAPSEVQWRSDHHWDSTIQYNTIQYNTIQYNTIQYQYNTGIGIFMFSNFLLRAYSRYREPTGPSWPQVRGGLGSSPHSKQAAPAQSWPTTRVRALKRKPSSLMRCTARLPGRNTASWRILWSQTLDVTAASGAIHVYVFLISFKFLLFTFFCGAGGGRRRHLELCMVVLPSVRAARASHRRSGSGSSRRRSGRASRRTGCRSGLASLRNPPRTPTKAHATKLGKTKNAC